jgi:hypothetical protein
MHTMTNRQGGDSVHRTATFKLLASSQAKR